MTVLDKGYKHLIGRLLLVSLFLVTGLRSMLFDFNGFLGAVKSKNLPFPMVVTVLALLIKIVSSLMIIFDCQTNYAAISLIVFILLATVMFHNAFKDKSQFNAMFKNIAVMGGLTLLLDCNKN